MIGDRVPVITNSVTPVSTGTPVVTGTVQYLDVGLKLEVEPDIHMDGEVAIKTFLEVSTIANQVTNAQSGSVAYQIGTRNATTVLRLKDGETQVLGGLISDNDSKTAAKVPGLGDFPILGRLFSSHNDNSSKTEIILSITPHIIRNNHRPDAELAQFWSGTDATLRSKPLTLQTAGLIKTGPTIISCTRANTGAGGTTASAEASANRRRQRSCHLHRRAASPSTGNTASASRQGCDSGQRGIHTPGRHSTSSGPGGCGG